MKKIFAFFAAMSLLLMLSFVFAEANVDDITKRVAELKSIPQGDITNVTEVNCNNLPNELNISCTADSNVGLFKVELKTGDPSFVITFSEKGFQKISQAYYATSFLSFGLNEEKNASTFLRMSSGVEGSLENGYVMVRSGSITGISTNLDVVQTNEGGSIRILIYKNGELVGLGNMFDVSSQGTKKDYDIQSLDIVNFNPGDTISVYLDSEGSASFSDVTTIVEISTSMN